MRYMSKQAEMAAKYWSTVSSEGEASETKSTEPPVPDVPFFGVPLVDWLAVPEVSSGKTQGYTVGPDQKERQALLEAFLRFGRIDLAGKLFHGMKRKRLVHFPLSSVQQLLQERNKDALEFIKKHGLLSQANFTHLLRLCDLPTVEFLLAMNFYALENPALLLGLDDPKKMGLLIAWGAEPNEVDDLKRTPLFYAKSAEEVEALVAAGADVTHVDRLGRTAIFGQSDARVLSALLEAEADPNHLDSGGRTALFTAKTPAVVDCLLAADVDINHCGKDGKTAVLFSIVPQVVQHLLGKGAVVDRSHILGCDPSIASILTGHLGTGPRVVQAEEEGEAEEESKAVAVLEPVTRDELIAWFKANDTAQLALAMSQGRLNQAVIELLSNHRFNAMRWLLEQDFPVNHVLDKCSGKTAIFYARNLSMVRLLRFFGADPTHRDAMRETAVEQIKRLQQEHARRLTAFHRLEVKKKAAASAAATAPPPPVRRTLKARFFALFQKSAVISAEAASSVPSMPTLPLPWRDRLVAWATCTTMSGCFAEAHPLLRNALPDSVGPTHGRAANQPSLRELGLFIKEFPWSTYNYIENQVSRVALCDFALKLAPHVFDRRYPGYRKVELFLMRIKKVGRDQPPPTHRSMSSSL